MGSSTYAVNEDGWPLAPEGYALEMEVGQGAFAKVMKAYCADKDQHVGIKIMALENITTSLEEIMAEVRTMKLAKHENVLGLFCCFVVKSDLWLIMPLMDKGSCYYVLRTLRKKGKIPDGHGLSEEHIATVLRELLQGLAYIHDQGQIHRDIKAGNILLSSDGRVAIADFGVAGWLSEAGSREEGQRRTFVGTPCWMAPEVMEQTTGYNEKADIWSVGITALELLKGYAPYSKFAPMQVLLKTIREPPPSIRSYADPPGSKPLEVSDKFNRFVARCLQKDPRARPSATELLSDPFIKKGLKNSKFAETLLAEIPEVGANAGGGTDSDSRPPGYTPIQFLQKGVTLVPGTTWVFPDDQRGEGSGSSGSDTSGGSVAAAGGTASGAGNAQATNEDEMQAALAELEAGFEELGGEAGLLQ